MSGQNAMKFIIIINPKYIFIFNEQYLILHHKLLTVEAALAIRA